MNKIRQKFIPKVKPLLAVLFSSSIILITSLYPMIARADDGNSGGMFLGAQTALANGNCRAPISGSGYIKLSEVELSLTALGTPDNPANPGNPLVVYLLTRQFTYNYDKSGFLNSNGDVVSQARLMLDFRLEFPWENFGNGPGLPFGFATAMNHDVDPQFFNATITGPSNKFLHGKVKVTFAPNDIEGGLFNGVRAHTTFTLTGLSGDLVGVTGDGMAKAVVTYTPQPLPSGAATCVPSGSPAAQCLGEAGYAVYDLILHFPCTNGD